MAVYLSPVGGVAAQFFTNSGVILSGGKLYTYAAGTTTSQTTYTSSSGNTNHTNPIILDSAGRVPGGEIWLNAPPYKFVLNTSADVLIASYDNVSGLGAALYQIQNFTGNGSTLVFTLSTASLGENYSFVYINGVYQNKNTYDITGATLTFSQAPPYTSLIEVMYN
jgi:Domain of unknown function (DUF4183)